MSKLIVLKKYVYYFYNSISNKTERNVIVYGGLNIKHKYFIFKLAGTLRYRREESIALCSSSIHTS